MVDETMVTAVSR